MMDRPVPPERVFLSGDEAVALGAFHAGVALGTGYPGTPSTEILEAIAGLGGRAQWAPNEKVAMEVAIGVAFAGARALVTMKHVGLNVAADPFFTAAYTGVRGGLVVVSADDPGMASSQNEQDNRRFAVAAGIPMLEPSDSDESYRFVLEAFRISEEWRIPVLLRMTTRVCHSKTVVRPLPAAREAPEPSFEHDRPGLVMIPAYARPAHRRLRKKLAEIAAWNETSDLNSVLDGDRHLGIIASGISCTHAREVVPGAKYLKLGMTYPLPFGRIREFAKGVERTLVIEEGDPYLVESIRAEGIAVEGKPEVFRFGELNAKRIRRILAGDISPEPSLPPGKPPQLCQGCPHRSVFGLLHDMDLIVAGDIGCYTLGVLSPFEAMDTCVCMGASIGVGLGLRHVLPPAEARRVVSVIGDSTFVHSGITGVVEMVYNPPPTGHLVLILDNGTTAMTGLQEHPGTGRSLEHRVTGKLVIEDVARAAGVRRVHVSDPVGDRKAFEALVRECLAGNDTAVIVARRPCILAAPKIRGYEEACGQGAPPCGLGGGG
jgi:indolepyruvate ferredoxin oxidoreductase alpha subunit